MCCAVLAKTLHLDPSFAVPREQSNSVQKVCIKCNETDDKINKLGSMGYHKNDVNLEFTMVIELFKIVIKTSTIFFQDKSFPDSPKYMLQEIFNKYIQS